jgi:tRNA threonylcarbamoyladenosine biosynthesis protein TsaE
MRLVELASASPDETHAIGVALGAVLLPRDFIGLDGRLGAGKTALVRGLAEGAGVPADEVTSPSYSIIQSYQGRLLLHHADLFRLMGEADLYATGYYELLESEGAWVVEWVSQVPGAAPPDALLVEMSLTGPSSRRLVARATGPASTSLLERWLGDSTTSRKAESPPSGGSPRSG